jgi:FMN phosphatase YigB (HAD superfamily)
MAYKSLLLDIDGVLIRDKFLLNHVKDNCARYVQYKLPDCKNPRETNRLLYLVHGHTGIGLSKVFKIDSSDFNEKVYDRKLLDHLAEVIYGTEFQLEAKKLYEMTSEKMWKTTLFTNSPIEWAGPVARAIGDNVYIKTNANKPLPEAYKSFPTDHTHVFVDDSLKNLRTSRWMDNWYSVHFSEYKDPGNWCSTVSSIGELSLYLDSFEKKYKV